MKLFSKLGFASESGQALVEMSVVGSLLVLLFLGVTEFGKVVYSSIEVSNSAKAGAQYGAQNGTTATDSTGIQNAAKAAASDLSALTATSSFACVCSDGTSSTCQNSDCSNSHIEESVTVNTTVTVTPLIRLPGLPASFTVTGKAVQKCLQ
jgi:Flp pilus assembly protein TadG